jgi:hypothetical protein
MLPPRCLDAALKTRSLSSHRTWRLLIRSEANREDAFNDVLHRPMAAALLRMNEVFASAG